MAEAVPPAVPDAPPGPVPLPQPPRTYAAFYENDPFGGQCAGAYGTLTVAPGDARLSPAQIKQVLATRPEDKLAFVMMAEDGKTVLLHRFRQYNDPFGAQPGPMNGALLAVKGEVHAMGVTVVQLPENAFALAEGSAPPFAAVIEALWDAPADQADWLMGPYAAGAAEVEAATVRRLMLVPNRYLRPLLEARLTARELWEQVVQPLIGDQLENDCALFVAWARRTIVNPGEGAPAGQSIRLPMPAVLELEGRVAEHVSSRFLLDLPGRDPAHQAGNVAGLLAAGFGSMSTAMDRQSASAEQRQVAQKAAEQSVQGRWGAINRLLRVCRVEHEDQLPPIYKIAAKAGQKADRVVLQEAITLRVAEDGTSMRYPFVRAQLAKSFSNLLFRAQYSGCMETGMSIYHFCLGGDQAAAKMNLVAQQYDDALAGPGVTVDQLQQVAPKMSAKTPISANILLDAYEDYAALLDVILGEGHEVAVHFRDFLAEMRGMRTDLDKRFARDDLTGQWLTREIHVQMDYWFGKQEMSDAPFPKPELGVLVEMVRFQRKHNEERPPGPKKPPASSGGASSGTGTGGGGGGGSTSGGTSGVKIDNPTPPPAGLVFWRQYSVTRFKALHPVTPNNDTGTPFCINWHKRGTCFTNCGRKEDHRHHNANETARFLAHLGSDALLAPPPETP
jgi:hypothetical protein